MTAEGRRYIEEVVIKSRNQTRRFYGVSACWWTSLCMTVEEASKGDELIQSDGVMIAIAPQQVRPLQEGVSLHGKEHYGELSLVLEGYTPASI